MYDLTVITDNEKDIDAITAHFKHVGAVIKRQTDLGVKPFAYPIAKKKEGIYTTFIIELAPEKLKDLNRELTIDPKILRHLVVKTNQVEPIKTAEELGSRSREYKENQVKETPKATKPKSETEVKIEEEKKVEDSKERKVALDKKLEQIISEK
jgi:ribosomal protein S6